MPPPTLSGPVFPSVSGKALEGPPLADSARLRLPLGRDVNPAVSFIELDRFALALDTAGPFRLESTDNIELVHGVARGLPVLLSWSKEVKEPFPPLEVSIGGLGEGGKPLPGGV